MYSFNIRLADINICVECLYASTKEFCKGYITEDTVNDIKVVINPADIQAEREKDAKERRLEGLTSWNPSPAYLETLALYRKIADALIDYDTILFHGSSLAIDGDGYIFTAKSGTGKSTHTRLWREVFGDRVVMVNDDKPLIKITKDEVRVYGTPWCGKHNLGENISVPLRAIISLERAKNNKIEKSTVHRLFPRVLSQVYRTKNVLGLQKTLTLVDNLLKAIDVYELGCNMNLDAATVAYKGIRGEL